MGKIVIGQSYDASELAELCGQEEDERYQRLLISGGRAEVICQDEGNGVVKVLEIRSQTPVCPYCLEDIDSLHTNKTSQLSYVDGKWVLDTDTFFEAVCSNCTETLNQEELDSIGVPNELR